MTGEFDKGAKVARWERQLDNPEAALKQIGVLMVAESQQAFRDQRIGETEWEPRAPVNVMGVIADFHAGRKEPHSRRFERRPVLRDTGRLMASVTYKVMGKAVEVGSVLPYAATQHHGKESNSKPINDQVRTALAAWLKKKGSKYRKALGWILNKKFRDKVIVTKVRKRPIVAITKQTVEDVREVVGAVLEAS